MNLLMSCIGRRSYVAQYFRAHLSCSDRIIGTSNTPWTPAFLACDQCFLLPSYSDEDAYGAALLDLCERERIDALLSFMDQDVVVLSGLRHELQQRGTVPVLPPNDLAVLCLDKWLAYEFFQAHALETASTFRDYESALDAVSACTIDFPLMVKPRFGFGRANTFLAHNERELDVLFHYQKDMLIQERLVGEEYDLDLLCDFDGNALAIVPWRKYSSRLGETEQAITVDSPPLLDFGLALVKALGHHIGPMDVDLFVTGDSIQILEMNPRFGGGYPVSHLAGADFPALILRLLRGESVEPRIGDYRHGVVMMKDIVPFGGLQNEVFIGDMHIKKDGLLSVTSKR